MDEVNAQIFEEIKRIYINCPDCAAMGDDDQYTCTTCWCEGGNGRINVFEWFMKNWEDIKNT